MTFPVVGSNIPLTYEISNSLRFNGTADSCYLSRTPSSTTDRQKFTISFWVKRAKVTSSRENMLFESRPSGPVYFAIAFRNSGSSDPDRILFQDNNGMNVTFAPRYRDVSAWYHIVASFDTTQATASNRAKLYVNGTQITDLGSLTTYPSQNANLNWNVNQIMSVGGSFDSTNQSPDIYLAEAHSIDGQQLDASSFGEFDLNSGVWKPKQYEGTYGTNGFYLKFNNSDNMGEDSSGNDNTFTPVNLSGPTDVTTDTPTNNFATINPLDKAPSLTLSEGNLQLTSPGNGTYNYMARSNFVIPQNSGKWFWEVKVTSSFIRCATGISQIDGLAGLSGSDTNSDPVLLDTSPRVWIVSHGGGVEGAGSATSGFPGCAWNTQNDIATFMYDSDAGEIYFAVNGTIGNSGSAIATGITGDVTPIHRVYGRASDSATTTIQVNHGNPVYSLSSAVNDTNGYGNFEHAPLSGYKSLCTQNLATALSPTIDDGSQYFNTVLWTGNATDDRSITGVGFAPDFVWTKERSSTSSHIVHDTTRGATYTLIPNQNASESVQADILQAFESDGFQIGTSGAINENGQTYVGWNWKANGGTTSSNTDGSITSTVQTGAGFSIVTYTGNATTGATVGHGLGVAPKIVLIKKRNSISNWVMQNTNLNVASGDCLFLDTTDANTTIPSYWNAVPTSTVFTLGNNSTPNGSGDTYVAYCFAEIEGYSKFGSYTGNGSSDGTFIYTGFRPAFFLLKRTDTANAWNIFDSTRETYNPEDLTLYPNQSDAEYTETDGLDFLSNGVKMREGNPWNNASGGTYIYLAFAENPFVTSGAVPVTAR